MNVNSVHAGTCMFSVMLQLHTMVLIICNSRFQILPAKCTCAHAGNKARMWKSRNRISVLISVDFQTLLTGCYFGKRLPLWISRTLQIDLHTFSLPIIIVNCYLLNTPPALPQWTQTGCVLRGGTHSIHSQLQNLRPLLTVSMPCSPLLDRLQLCWESITFLNLHGAWQIGVKFLANI